VSKRILILACSYPSSLDPLAGIFVQAQAGVLAAEYSVAVLNPMIYGIGGFIRRIQQTAESDTGLERVPVVRPRSFLSRTSPRSIRKGLLKSARAGLNELCNSWGKPDLVAAHFAVYSGWLGLQIAKDLNIPYVLHEHASPFSMYLRDSESRELARLAIAGASSVIAVSPHLEREILDFDPAARTVAIGNFVDTDHFTLATQPRAPQPFTFLSVGKASSQKGFSYLLEAAAILARREEKQFRIVLGGDGPELSALRRLAVQLQISHVVDFLGSIPPSLVLENMRACDCVVMPSLHESFCIVLAEAMACGKPVISTRCGGPEFFVDAESGYLVNVSDPVDLADTMAAVINKERTLDSSIIRKKIHSRFGKEAFLQNIADLYSSVLQ